MNKTIIYAVSLVLISFILIVSANSATKSDLKSVPSPAQLASDSIQTSGSIEIRVLGSDQFIKEEKYKTRILVIPQDKWETRKEGETLDEYFIAESSHLLVTGLKPGKYVVEIQTPHEMRMNFNTISPSWTLPNKYYVWDGSESEGMSWREGKIFYTTSYIRDVVREQTSLVIAIRLSRDSDINNRLIEFTPSENSYVAAVIANDKETMKILQLLRKYGKAFVAEDHVLFLKYTKTGDVSELRRIPKDNSVVKPNKMFFSDAQADNIALETKQILPTFLLPLTGTNEVRVKNPNDFKVAVGLRSGDRGKDFEVPPSSTTSVLASNGKYQIYFVYSDKPDELYQGDNFTLDNNGIEIQIVKVVGGNYGIRRVK